MQRDANPLLILAAVAFVAFGYVGFKLHEPYSETSASARGAILSMDLSSDTKRLFLDELDRTWSPFLPRHEASKQTVLEEARLFARARELEKLAASASQQFKSMEIAKEESDMCLVASRVPGTLVVAAEALCSDPKALEGECVVRFLGEKGGAAYRMKKDKTKGWRVVESASFNRNQTVVRMSGLIALRAILHTHVPASN